MPLHHVDQLFFVIYALILPLVIVAVRDQIRRTRSKITQELQRYFGGPNDKFPSLTAVIQKYANVEQAALSSTSGPSDDARLKRLEDNSVLVAALLYAVVTAFGWALILLDGKTATDCVQSSTLSYCSTLWNAAALFVPPSESSALAAQTTAIAAFAFLGAYVFSIRFLIRALMNYEVNPLTLIRATSQIIIGVVVALVIWHSAIKLAPESVLVGRLWLGIAFVIGFIPEYAVNAIGRQVDLWAGLGVRKIPGVGGGCVPLEIIDGIDMWTRFRLEEARIEDVQNLSTCNPIELYVDTPYGLFEVIDWVLQAQLCTAVGPEAFEKLKKTHIRTIFDFERAVFDPNSSPAVVDQVGKILAEYWPVDDHKLSTETIQHLGRIIVDDVHVHRVRQIWNMIRSVHGAEHEWLRFESSPLVNQKSS
jgi:hypothetical protein